MIEDDRQRQKMKTNQFNCDMCEFKTGSVTIMKKHISTTHKETENRIMEIEMRKRQKCDKCNFKSTSEDLKETHRYKS